MAPDTKKCPYCAEDIRVDAIKCKHCLSDLTASFQSNSNLSADDGSKRLGEITIAILLILFLLIIWGLIYIKLDSVVGALIGTLLVLLPIALDKELVGEKFQQAVYALMMVLFAVLFFLIKS